MTYLFKTPIDMPRGTHYGNNYWIFQSRKVGRRVTAFSNLEYENLITLEMDPNVEFYCEQPCEQTVIIDGKRNQTAFDVYVVYKDGREEFQEIKYQEELDSDSKAGERSRKQIEVQRSWCLQNGYPYVVRTDKDIETGVYTIRNLTYLCSKARRYNVANKIMDNSILQFLSERGSISIGQLYASGRITAYTGLDYLADLFYRGLISFSDFETKPITNTTEVSVL